MPVVPVGHNGLPGVVGITITTFTAAVDDPHGTAVEEYLGWPFVVPCWARHFPSIAADAFASLPTESPAGRRTWTIAIATAATIRTRGITLQRVHRPGRATRLLGPHPGGRGGASAS
jgi:hypothetical protein